MNQQNDFNLACDHGSALGFSKSVLGIRSVSQSEVEVNGGLSPNLADGVYLLQPKDPITKKLQRFLYRLTKTGRTVVREVRTADGGWRYDTTFKI